MDRAARIRRIIDDARGRGARDVLPTASQLHARYPELMPELWVEWVRCGLDQAVATSVATQTLDIDAFEPINDLVSDLQKPDALPGYEILHEIHRGGQGVVFVAVQKATQRRVAVKVMRSGPFAGARERARFEREVRVLGRLKHPNIVTIHDSGTASGCFYYAMDYVAGQSLDEYARNVGRRIRSILEVFIPICSAVQAAHERGIVHRDLKPANIRVENDGRPQVLDFGLAKLLTPDAGAQISHTGQFFGTVKWASPEQVTGHPDDIDARTDVYALGVLLYEMLTGAFPYNVEGRATAVLERIVHDTPRPPSAHVRELRGDVETIILKCLQKERQRRYAHAGEIAQDLQNFLDCRPISARRDSLGYVLRKRATRTVAHHRGAACAVAVVLAFAVGQLLVALNWPTRGLDRWFEAKSQWALQALHPEAWHDEIRVIALDDATVERAAELAARVGLEGVDGQQPVTWRALHGKLMERLAEARPRALVWDLKFPSVQPAFDPGFAHGAEVLRKAGTRIVAGAADETRAGAWAISPAIGSAVDAVGWTHLVERHRAGKRLPLHGAVLLVDHPTRAPLPSLSLAALVQSYRPRRAVELHAPPALNYIEMSLAAAPGAADPARADDELAGPVRIFFPERQEEWSSGAPPGMDIKNRWAAVVWAFIPSSRSVAAVTTPYHEVFAADRDSLRSRFEDRIVVVGDTRDRTSRVHDRSVIEDGFGGRLESHCYLHAAAIATLRRGLILRTPGLPAGLLGILVISVLGVLAGGLVADHRRSRLRRGMLASLLTLIAFTAIAGLPLAARVVLSPGPLLAALLCAAIGGWAVARIASGLGSPGNEMPTPGGTNSAGSGAPASVPRHS